MARKNISRLQTFSIRAPDAISVQLVGDFTSWQEEAIEMEKQKGGVWKITVALTPGTYHYRFVVDGEWRDDSDCASRREYDFANPDTVRRVC
jgi:1,4-alpha-glucan branching enzyme